MTDGNLLVTLGEVRKFYESTGSIRLKCTKHTHASAIMGLGLPGSLSYVACHYQNIFLYAVNTQQKVTLLTKQTFVSPFSVVLSIISYRLLFRLFSRLIRFWGRRPRLIQRVKVKNDLASLLKKKKL